MYKNILGGLAVAAMLGVASPAFAAGQTVTEDDNVSFTGTVAKECSFVGEVNNGVGSSGLAFPSIEINGFGGVVGGIQPLELVPQSDGGAQGFFGCNSAFTITLTGQPFQTTAAAAPGFDNVIPYTLTLAAGALNASVTTTDSGAPVASATPSSALAAETVTLTLNLLNAGGVRPVAGDYNGRVDILMSPN